MGLPWRDRYSVGLGRMPWATFCPSWGKTGHIRASLGSTTKSTCECLHWAGVGPQGGSDKMS